MPKLENGLNKSKKDIRNFSHKKLYGVIDLTSLPKQGLGRKPLGILNQGTTDFCASYGVAAIRSFTEKLILDPFYIWAQAAKIRGDYKEWGMDLNTICKAAIKKGILAQQDESYMIDKGRDFLANWNNYPAELDIKAEKHIGGSYFEVDGSDNLFDSIKIALWQHKDENLTILTGCNWYASWLASGGIIKSFINEATSGHAFAIIDWKQIDNEDYLVAQLSSGSQVGDNGVFYIHKDIINNNNIFNFGAKIITDFDPEEYKKQQWNLLQLMKDYLVILSQYIKKFMENKLEIKPIQPMPEPIPKPIIEPKISRIIEWAKAIQQMEGWFNGSKSFRNNNPGNIKKLDGNFIKFNSYQEGFDYLCQYLRNACEGKHKAYSKGGESTLLEFFGIYAPPSENGTLNYAKFVADKLKISIDIKIKELL